MADERASKGAKRGSKEKIYFYSDFGERTKVKNKLAQNYSEKEMRDDVYFAMIQKLNS